MSGAFCWVSGFRCACLSFLSIISGPHVSCELITRAFSGGAGGAGL